MIKFPAPHRGARAKPRPEQPAGTRPRPVAFELTLRPLENDPVPVRDAQGGEHWRAVSCDAAFLASLPREGPSVGPGWYRASVRLVERGGRLAGPRLYVPFASGGYSEVRSVELQAAGGAWSGELFVPSPTRQFRFDPSIYPCEFECGPVEMVPIPGVRRWLRAGWEVARSLGRLRTAQLSMWLRMGLRVLFTRGHVG